jgi:peptidoglycan/LPS O-acetylase OafA/YrhL
MGLSVKQLEFLPRIESLRGIAALTVVGGHVGDQLSALPAHGWLDESVRQVLATLSNATGAVVTFFVLSGFVLARSLDGNSDPVRFLRNRVFRLFPAAMAVVTLLTLLHWQLGLFVGYEASFDPMDVILNLLMIRSDINGVMWSMTVECAATPLILISVWLFHRHGARPLWGLVALLFGLSFWGGYVHLLGGFTNLAPFYSFVIGVLVHFQGNRMASLIKPGMTTAVAIAAIAVYIFCGAKKQTAPILMIECLSAAMLIVLIAWRPAMGLFRPLDLRLVRFYGQISYSFYLLHMLGLAFAFRILDPLAPGALDVPLSIKTMLVTLVSILVTTPVAYLSWRFIEVPAIRFGRTSGNQPKLQVVN